MGKRDNNTRITFKNVKLPLNKSLNGGQILSCEVEEGMTKQKIEDEFIRKRRASLGYSSRQKAEQEEQCVSRKELSAFMEMKEGY